MVFNRIAVYMQKFGQIRATSKNGLKFDISRLCSQPFNCFGFLSGITLFLTVQGHSATYSGVSWKPKKQISIKGYVKTMVLSFVNNNFDLIVLRTYLFLIIFGYRWLGWKWIATKKKMANFFQVLFLHIILIWEMLLKH